MAEREIKNRVNIGSSSLILIFIVLCLSVFALLAIGNARSSYMLARKNADSVSRYYEADNHGEAFVALISEGSQAETTEYYRAETGTYETNISMGNGQILHVALKKEDGIACTIMSWKVYNEEEYEIDDSMAVWGVNQES